MTEVRGEAERLHLDAKPAALEMQVQRTAVVVVDMQNDFCTPGGSVETAGFDLSLVRSIIPAIADVLSCARSIGLQVIYLQHGYRPDLSDLGPPESRNAIAHLAAGVGTPFAAPDGSMGRIGVHDTWNTQIIDELAPQPGDVVIRKNRFSGFHDTPLESTLSSSGIETLVVTGCTTSICVEALVRDAMYRDYRPIVLSDCTAEPQGQANHDASLAIIESTLGWVSESRHLHAAAEALRPGPETGSPT